MPNQQCSNRHLFFNDHTREVFEQIMDADCITTIGGIRGNEL